MKHANTNLIAFAILVLTWSLTLYGFVHWATKYANRHPHKEKPGLSEIRSIAQENNLTYREVSAAVKTPKDRIINLPKIILSQTISIGFTLGVFALIRKLVARFTERKNAQQGVPGYRRQSAPQPKP